MGKRNNIAKNMQDEIYVYFINLWEDLIEDFKRGSFQLEIMNPHLLINNIVEEVKFNQFSNKEKKKYYKKKLGIIIKFDPVIKEFYKTEFIILLESFHKFSNDYLLSYVLSIQFNLSKKEYFKNLIKALKYTISNNCFDSQQKEELKILCRNIIIEFLLKGFDIDILLSVLSFKDNYIDIINTLEKFYSTKGGGHNYIIFQIKGLKGNNVDLNVGNINFYSPQAKNYIKGKKSDSESELFGSNMGKHYINAAYKIDFFEGESPVRKAIEEIEKALDLIRCYYSPKVNFEICSDNYLIVDNKGHNTIGGYKASDKSEWYRYHYSIDMKEYKLEEEFKRDFYQKITTLLFKDSDALSDIESRLVQSIHWYRKAEESKLFEDKLLFYWVIIDRLMKFEKNILLPEKERESSFILAKELFPSLLMNNVILGFGWNLYYRIRNIITNQSFLHRNDKILNLNDELVKSSNLKPTSDSTIYLRPFINHLEQIKNLTNNEYLKEKIYFIQNLHNNNGFVEEQLGILKNQIKYDILIIYNFRNKIVHNAYLDNNILPYFVAKFRRYSGDLLRMVIHEFISNGIKKLDEIYIKNHLRERKLLTLIKNDKHVDLIKYLDNN